MSGNANFGWSRTITTLRSGFKLTRAYRDYRCADVYINIVSIAVLMCIWYCDYRCADVYII